MGNIKLETNIINDKYTEYIYDAFEIQDNEKSIVNIPYDLSEAKTFHWNIGVIYGNSGSGKTSILSRIGKLTNSNFDPDKPLISNFDWLEPKEATLLLTSIGLSSVPTWLRPYKLLSNGEQYRAELAYKVGKAKEKELIIIDEYTSVVDRDVAKAMSFALQKYIRRTNKRIILASCHYDIMEWLMPDWTVSPQKGGALERDDWLRQGKPEIELRVSRTKSDTWNFFKKYHYLTENCSKSYGHLLFTWNDRPVGICVYANMPSGSVKNAMRLSRTVVMPDYQGLGIGKSISEFAAAILTNAGKIVYTKTVNPALGEHREHSDKWVGIAKNKKARKGEHAKEYYGNISWKLLGRPSYCHKYVGEGLSGHEDLLLTMKELRKRNKSN